jgi:hypothetical protein
MDTSAVVAGFGCPPRLGRSRDEGSALAAAHRHRRVPGQFFPGCDQPGDAWLVNIAFPLAMFLKFKRYDRSFAAARIAVLVTIPFSWMVFVLLPVLPREGHVLWVTGMLLALFSEEIAARRRASASSRGPESSAPHSGPAMPSSPSAR